MSASAGPTAAIVVIGEEILTGRVQDENAAFLKKELRALGVAVRRVEVVPDVLADIVEALRRLAPRYTHVFTSGGIGPTHDDVTLPALAEAFGMHLERRPELEKLIRMAAGDTLNERDLRMADIPHGARLEHGSDRGVWPVIAIDNVYALPGVPPILRRKFISIRGQFRAQPFFGRTLYSRDGEGSIAAALDAVVAAYPAVTVGSYPQMGASDHKVKITIDGRDAAQVDAAAAALAADLGPVIARRE